MCVNDKVRGKVMKNYLIITFIVVEILSLLFNSCFLKINIGQYGYFFNYSIIFFCIGFFIVDTVNLLYSTREAKKFFQYKVYAQAIFLIFALSAIKVYGLENTQIDFLIKSSWLAITSGIIATFIGYNVMNTIMSKMKKGIYQGRSVFRRYIYSTLPGEIAFSFVFTILTFSSNHNIKEIISIFITSSIAKLVFSTIFSGLMSILLYIPLFSSKEKIINIKVVESVSEAMD
jgi:uncharacterized PurR-regulated membrane protein YhhQ (DUF165 family)